MRVINNPNKNPLPNSEREKRVSEPGFGKYYTDNMVIAQWSEATGWQDAELRAYGPLTLDPATMVFHYGQEVFEGMKAYSQPDGGVSLLGPMQMLKDLPNLQHGLHFLRCQLNFLYKRWRS